MKVSAQYAESHLPQLLSAAESGEEVEITSPEHTSFRLTLVEAKATPVSRTGNRTLGAGRGELRIPSETEWSHMDEHDSHRRTP